MSLWALPVHTVGHSTHPLGTFVSLLRQHQIAYVADIRSAPYSRFNPQFNREPLEQGLKRSGIGYGFMGGELGGRVEDPACYVEGRVQYALVAELPAFIEGLEKLQRLATNQRLALMCAEKEPLECHRTLLVAAALAKKGARVMHILAEGGVETHEAAMERLLDVVGVPHQDLFMTYEELVAEAVKRQAARVAYVEEIPGRDGDRKAT